MHPRRKIVLFVVEGPTDRTTLFNPISELYERIDPNIQVIFKPFHGDITADKYKKPQQTKFKSVAPGSFESTFYQKIVKPLQNEYEGVYPKCIDQIILITDTDGAYIPDDAIKEDHSVPNLIYRPDCIISGNKSGTQYRNMQKKEVLNHLVELSLLNEIKVQSKTIPFKAYFFSRHLEHFLYNEPNISIQDKIKKADEFYYSYLGKAEEFKNLLINNDYSSIGLSYEESWEYIKKDVNSLSRRTNLDLLIYDLWEEGSK